MPNDEKPDPLDDVKKGLGLLFRAAKNAAKNLPTDPIEKVVLEGAREVGRAVENVASSIEREVFGDRRKKDKETPSDAPPADAASADAPAQASPGSSPPPAAPIVTPPASASTPTSNGADAKAPDEPPKGPRVA